VFGLKLKLKQRGEEKEARGPTLWPRQIGPRVRGVNPEGLGSRPPDFGLGSCGGCGQVWENTISHFRL